MDVSVRVLCPQSLVDLAENPHTGSLGAVLDKSQERSELTNPEDTLVPIPGSLRCSGNTC